MVEKFVSMFRGLLSVFALFAVSLSLVAAKCPGEMISKFQYEADQAAGRALLETWQELQRDHPNLLKVTVSIKQFKLGF